MVMQRTSFVIRAVAAIKKINALIGVVEASYSSETIYCNTFVGSPDIGSSFNGSLKFREVHKMKWRLWLG